MEEKLFILPAIPGSASRIVQPNPHLTYKIGLPYTLIVKKKILIRHPARIPQRLLPLLHILVKTLIHGTADAGESLNNSFSTVFLVKGSLPDADFLKKTVAA
jgi:hypothetical protein